MPRRARGRAARFRWCAHRGNRARRRRLLKTQGAATGCRRLAAHVPEQLADRHLELRSMDHAVDHAVVEQELGGLESLRQVLAKGLFDHAGPANPMTAPGSARIASPSMA